MRGGAYLVFIISHNNLTTMKKFLLICLLAVIAMSMGQFALHRIHVQQQEINAANMRKYMRTTYDPRGLNTVHEQPLPHNTLRVNLTRKEAEAIQRLELE